MNRAVEVAQRFGNDTCEALLRAAKLYAPRLQLESDLRDPVIAKKLENKFLHFALINRTRDLPLLPERRPATTAQPVTFLLSLENFIGSLQSASKFVGNGGAIEFAQRLGARAELVVYSELERYKALELVREFKIPCISVLHKQDLELLAAGEATLGREAQSLVAIDAAAPRFAPDAAFIRAGADAAALRGIERLCAVVATQGRAHFGTATELVPRRWDRLLVAAQNFASSRLVL